MEMQYYLLHFDWLETTWFRLEQIVIVFDYLEQSNILVTQNLSLRNNFFLSKSIFLNTLLIQVLTLLF